jgi:bifunctional DNA-binding transcriptional regulator/antitoxin component of YhaV-PrlF toxin-antitoxin module
MASTPTERKIVRLQRDGRITLPAEFLKQLGITDDGLLEVVLDGNALHLSVPGTQQTAAGTPWFKELYELFAPQRVEAAKYPEEEIDAAIDEAVRESRAARASHRL